MCFPTGLAITFSKLEKHTMGPSREKKKILDEEKGADAPSEKVRHDGLMRVNKEEAKITTGS